MQNLEKFYISEPLTSFTMKFYVSSSNQKVCVIINKQ